MGDHRGWDPRALQHAMVSTLLARGAISSATVEAAFRAVPRHTFLPGVAVTAAYEADAAVPTHFGPDGVSISSSSAPTIMAVMLERLDCRPGDRVLEIGTGTGYNAAILSHLVGREGAVTSIELGPEIAAEAETHLAAAGIASVQILVRDAWSGDPDGAPFDRVIATVGVWDIAPAWIQQLRPGGRLVAPVWIGPGLELAVAFERRDRGLVSLSVEWCGFMRLRGDHAGPEAWAVAGEWNASVVAPAPGDVDRLASLLDSTASTEPAPPLPRFWFAQLALREPQAIQLVARGDWRRRAYGVFDPVAASLALIEGDALFSFGGREARDRLVDRIATMEAFDLETISIAVIPMGDATPPDALVLPRRDHQLVLHRMG